MRCRWIFGVFCSIAFCLCGCHLLPQTYPTGTWESEDGKIIINFSEYGFSENAGTIELDQEVVPLYWMISDIDCLSVYKSTALVDTVLDESEYYFDGYLRYSYEDNTFTVKVINSQISQYHEDTCFALVPCEGAGTTSELGDLPDAGS